MTLSDKLDELDLSFATIISQLSNNTLTPEHKALIADLLSDWHHSERAVAMAIYTEGGPV